RRSAHGDRLAPLRRPDRGSPVATRHARGGRGAGAQSCLRALPAQPPGERLLLTRVLREARAGLLMRVLGIETSCDETGAAVVDETGRVHSDVVRTQISLHAPYGGVVPEIAARDHIRALTPVVREALARADMRL